MHPPPLRRNPMLMPFVFAALGAGLLAWYGLAWYELPVYSEGDITASVEANLAVDLARLGPNLQPDASGLLRLRAQIRSEVEGDINQDRRDSERGVGAGLLCLIVAAGQALFAWLTRTTPQA